MLSVNLLCRGYETLVHSLWRDLLASWFRDVLLGSLFLLQSWTCTHIFQEGNQEADFAATCVNRGRLFIDNTNFLTADLAHFAETDGKGVMFMSA